jgi:predicted DCC family thiol-disulfide oxidoreductase YuxK
MNQFMRKIDEIWFPALQPERLALMRILTGLFSLWYLAPRYSMLQKLGQMEADLFEPVGLAALLSGPVGSGWVEALVAVTLLANVAYMAGWQYRFSGPVFGVSLMALLCYRNSWSMIYHSDNALVAHVMILGFTRAADALSWDSWKKRGPQAEAHWRYGWPVQLASAVTLMTYMLAGVAKLASGSGLAWATGESLRSQIAVDTIRKELLGAESSAIAFQLYDQVWLFTALGIFSLVVEVLAPLALLSPRLGRVWAVNAFGMHWGIYLLMHITFRYQMTGLLYLSFLPLERVVAYFRRRPLAEMRPGSDVVVFDGHCRFCQGQMRLLQWADVTGRLSFLSLHDERARQVLPDMSIAQLMEAMVVVDQQGGRHAGAYAVRYLFRRLPMLWPMAPLLHFPGTMPLWLRLYGEVARRRYALDGIDCEDGTCQVKGYGHV